MDASAATAWHVREALRELATLGGIARQKDLPPRVAALSLEIERVAGADS